MSQNNALLQAFQPVYATFDGGLQVVPGQAVQQAQEAVQDGQGMRGAAGDVVEVVR